MRIYQGRAVSGRAVLAWREIACTQDALLLNACNAVYDAVFVHAYTPLSITLRPIQPVTHVSRICVLNKLQ